MYMYTYTERYVHIYHNILCFGQLHSKMIKEVLVKQTCLVMTFDSFLHREIWL